tara:strand:+ start:98 stop:448 length:351 start_codon:yes stop_codon:yes gene_type:complete
MKKVVVKKPWGEFVQFTHDEKSTVKILDVSPGEILSLQSHLKRAEYWYVLEGNPTMVIGEKTGKYKPGDSIRIGKRVKHRISNKTMEKVRILEISTGNFDEKDIIRYEDKYNRIKK